MAKEIDYTVRIGRFFVFSQGGVDELLKVGSVMSGVLALLFSAFIQGVPSMSAAGDASQYLSVFGAIFIICFFVFAEINLVLSILAKLLGSRNDVWKIFGALSVALLMVNVFIIIFAMPLLMMARSGLVVGAVDALAAGSFDSFVAYGMELVSEGLLVVAIIASSIYLWKLLGDGWLVAEAGMVGVSAVLAVLAIVSNAPEVMLGLAGQFFTTYYAFVLFGWSAEAAANVGRWRGVVLAAVGIVCVYWAAVLLLNLTKMLGG